LNIRSLHLPPLTRRSLLLSTASFGLLAALPLHAQTLPPIHVAKGTGCECCSAWVEHLRAEGFTVTEEELYGMLLINFKLDNGIPQRMTSCHTGKIDGYMIEGHVPAADIRRLLQDRPDAIGLAVPGMPYGSPGMGDETDREAYEVFLIARDGTTSVFTTYPAA
jgi:hypothetical protein